MTNKHTKALVLISISDTQLLPVREQAIRRPMLVAAISVSGNKEDDAFVRGMVFDDFCQSVDDILAMPWNDLGIEKSKFPELSNGLHVFTCDVWASEYHGPDGSDYDCGIEPAESVRPFVFADYQLFFGGAKP